MEGSANPTLNPGDANLFVRDAHGLADMKMVLINLNQ